MLITSIHAAPLSEGRSGVIVMAGVRFNFILLVEVPVLLAVQLVPAVTSVVQRWQRPEVGSLLHLALEAVATCFPIGRQLLDHLHFRTVLVHELAEHRLASAPSHTPPLVVFNEVSDQCL